MTNTNENTADNQDKRFIGAERLYVAWIEQTCRTHGGDLISFTYIKPYIKPNPESIKDEAQKVFTDKERFYTEHYDDGCPQPKHFDLDLKIRSLEEIRVDGYRINLEKLSS